MALANYADLLAAVGNWLQRDDLTARIPEFIALAEAEFNRRLRTIEMEARSTVTLTGDSAALPADFIGLRALSLANTRLDYITPAEAFEDTATGTPARYTIAEGSIYLRPAPSSGSLVIDYYKAVPALTVSNTTNWLMTKYPDLYLFATLAQAGFFVWDDRMVANAKARAEELFEQIETATNRERYGGRRLVMKPRISGVGIQA